MKKISLFSDKFYYCKFWHVSFGSRALPIVNWKVQLSRLITGRDKFDPLNVTDDNICTVKWLPPSFYPLSAENEASVIQFRTVRARLWSTIIKVWFKSNAALAVGRSARRRRRRQRSNQPIFLLGVSHHHDVTLLREAPILALHRWFHPWYFCNAICILSLFDIIHLAYPATAERESVLLLCNNLLPRNWIASKRMREVFTEWRRTQMEWIRMLRVATHIRLLLQYDTASIWNWTICNRKLKN